MTIGSRIKKVRRALDLTQTEFASRLGLTQNTVTRYETGDRNPSTAVLSLIVKAYNVSEEWLRTGEGEMFVPSPTSELDALAARYPQMTHETYVFIEKLVGLPESAQNTIMGFLREVVEGFGDVAPGTAALPGRKSPDGMSAEELHAELDRQLAEEKEAGAASEVS